MAMDPVNKKALKKDFKNRNDKDIDNDGDVDSSDEYLHTRRKAISKAIKNVKESLELDEANFKKGDIVIANSGPHKGDRHKIIHDFGDGTYNVKPLINNPRLIKYALGAAKAKASELKAVKESLELDEAKTDVYHKHMLKALGKSRLPKNHSYTSAIANNGDFIVRDGGGRVVGRIEKGDHNLKESFDLEEKVYSSDYNVGHEKSQFGGYRPHVTHKKTGKTMYLGQTSYKTPEHAKGHAAAYLKGYEQMGDQTANRTADEYRKANKQHVYKEEVELEEKAESQAQAIAARIALKHKREGTKPEAGTASADMSEEVEDLEELKKSTLASYVNKASDDRAQNALEIGKSGKINLKGLKRRQGIQRATKRLAKEEVELEEKAESQAQAIAARIALKHKREGTKPEAGTASADMMKMSEKDLEDYTKAKKGAPKKVSEQSKPDAAEVIRKRQQMKNISSSDKDKLTKIRDMLRKEKND